MDVMQTIRDFKQNLQAHASAGAAMPAQTGRQAGAGALAKSASAATPAAAGAASSGGSTTITANDFLQLLVAEMKNQDPTATQDPNAYIDQLVQVNSLQQLISINQDLTPPASGSTTTPTGHIARARTPLGSADGTQSAALARSMAPSAAQPKPASASGMANGGANGGLASMPGFGPGPGSGSEPAAKISSAAASLKRNATPLR